MWVLLGNGNGTFKPAIPGTGAGSVSFAFGCFDSDTNLDLATYGDIFVRVQKGVGDGTFVSNAAYSVGTHLTTITVADFNGDGTNDLAVATQSHVTILLGVGNGTFRPTATLGGLWEAVAVADFNGDGKLDLAVRYFEGFGMGVMLGNGDGTFQPAVYFGSMNDAIFPAMAVGDLNGDGKPDAAVLDLAGDVAVLLNTCTAAPVAGPQLSLSQSISSGVISWPVSVVYNLESTTNLASTNWLKATEPLSTNNGTVQVTVPFNSQAQFFRLHKQ